MARLVWEDKSLFNKVKVMEPAVDSLIYKVMEYEANGAQNNMRLGAPWTDRTGNARQGLFARAGRMPGAYYIVLYHTMPYGFWLEVKNSGRYAIVEPTIQPTGASVMKSLSKLFKALT